MIALDFSKLDSTILAYFKYISSSLGIEDAHFIHMVKTMSIPKLVMTEWNTILKHDNSIVETCNNLLKKEIAQFNLPLNKAHIHCHVHEGNPTNGLVVWSKEHNVDLVVVGNKQSHEGSGITSRRMAHRLDCSMLFIPENSMTPINEITVFFDFSKESIEALLFALSFHNKIADLKIKAIHVQEGTKSNLYPFSKKNISSTTLLREKTLAAFDKLIEEHQINEKEIEFVIIEQEKGSIAQTLIEYLNIRPTDLVIMGSIGHNKGHNIVFGSTTESFVDLYLKSPILTIR